MKHPYTQYEMSRTWKNIDKSVKDLIENSDIECNIPNADRIYSGLYN